MKLIMLSILVVIFIACNNSSKKDSITQQKSLKDSFIVALKSRDYYQVQNANKLDFLKAKGKYKSDYLQGTLAIFKVMEVYW